ncbi:mannose-6-phosphate isomerase [Candidatus Marinamargulisbacteria bacterium SCGC AG-414-C22]|nr:mannose-6-phosphate isomerase [Candidatus Marinamargulisbacteria bacterium SCGC AG-414-C22]
MTQTNNNRHNKPWGHYDILFSSPATKVKRIVVNPGHRLSYQYHHQRAEHWTIVKGTATVTLNGKDTQLNTGDHIHIPLKAKHRITNHTESELIFIEVQYGSYFGEDDIVRLKDDYQREDT